MTGFTLAYAVMRVCGGQPRKNPGAPELATKVDDLEKAAKKGLSQLHKETEKGNEELKHAISQAATLPQRGKVLMGILEAIKERNR